MCQPLDWRTNESTTCQILLDRSNRGLRLFNGEDVAEDTRLDRIPDFQIVKRREWERIGVLDQESFCSRRVRVKQIARHQEAAVGVNAHALMGLLTALEQYEIGNDTITCDPPGARLDVRPRDARPASTGRRLPRPALKGKDLSHEPSPLRCRQRSDTLQKLGHGHAVMVALSPTADKFPVSPLHPTSTTSRNRALVAA